MATTTNFGWETPDDTDLVKDGAAAMRTLGNSIDTSFVDLKGGTTGQILSKASNTDLDYAWITNDVGDITAVTAGTGISGGGTSGAVTITNSMATEITAAGDIIVGTGSGTFDNLPIGTTGQILTADTTVSPYKVKWANASTGGTYSTYTPTVKQPTTSITLTVNSGATFARYTQVGKMTHVQLFLTITGTGNANNPFNISVPVNANKTNFTAGTAHLYDASSGLVYSAEVFFLNADSVVLIGTTSNLSYLYLGDSGAAFSAALANNDQIVASFTYESV